MNRANWRIPWVNRTTPKRARQMRTDSLSHHFLPSRIDLMPQEKKRRGCIMQGIAIISTIFGTRTIRLSAGERRLRCSEAKRAMTARRGGRRATRCPTESSQSYLLDYRFTILRLNAPHSRNVLPLIVRAFSRCVFRRLVCQCYTDARSRRRTLFQLFRNDTTVFIGPICVVHVLIVTLTDDKPADECRRSGVLTLNGEDVAHDRTSDGVPVAFI